MSDTTTSRTQAVLDTLDFPWSHATEILARHAEQLERELAARTEAVTRDSVLDEIEKLIGAAEGRHFAAIGTAEHEEDKRRHGAKVAFAMELRAAIRALKRGEPQGER